MHLYNLGFEYKLKYVLFTVQRKIEMSYFIEKLNLPCNIESIIENNCEFIDASTKGRFVSIGKIF